MSLFNELKRRNVFRVTAAYVIVSWMLLQVSDTLVPALHLPGWFHSGVAFLLIMGLPVAIIFAWAFELTPEGLKKEKEVDRSHSIARKTGRKLDFAIIAVLSAALIILAGRTWFEGDNIAPQTASGPDTSVTVKPLVIMMDSHHPKRVYDEETIASGGTNADVVSDILLDLPIRRQKEVVGPDWHRDEEILGFEPDLIIIHYSAFRQEDSTGPRLRLRLLIEFFADTDTRFLIYSRGDEAWLEGAIGELLAELDQEHPGLLERVHVFGLPDHGEPKWRDPTTAGSLKLLTKTILATD